MKIKLRNRSKHKKKGLSTTAVGEIKSPELIGAAGEDHLRQGSEKGLPVRERRVASEGQWGRNQHSNEPAQRDPDQAWEGGPSPPGPFLRSICISLQPPHKISWLPTCQLLAYFFNRSVLRSFIQLKINLSSAWYLGRIWPRHLNTHLLSELYCLLFPFF